MTKHPTSTALPGQAPMPWRLTETLTKNKSQAAQMAAWLLLERIFKTYGPTYPAISKIASISTATPSGSVEKPSAERAWYPASSLPKIS